MTKLVLPCAALAALLALNAGCKTSSSAPADAALSESRSTAVYKNPLMDVQMADPHVLRVGDTYYLYATTHTRAYEVYSSQDLVHWTLKSEVFRDPRRGLWAPDVFHDKARSKFYLYYTANTQNPPTGPGDKVVGVAEADSPLGPFLDKGVLASNSIDGHLFYDRGKYYFYYVDIKDRFKIMAQPMSSPTQPSGEPVKVVEPTQAWESKTGSVTEGPFVLKRGSTYYLTYSGSSADSPNYGIGYATSSSPLGPFQKYAGNPIVSRTETVFGPGHHCVVEGPDKKLWLVYHQKWGTNTSWSRFLALDRIWFNKDGTLQAEATRGVERPAPAAKPPRL